MGAVLFEALEAIKTREQLQQCYLEKWPPGKGPVACHVFQKLTRWGMLSYMCHFRWFQHGSGGDFILFCKKSPNVRFVFRMVKFGFLIGQILTQYSPKIKKLPNHFVNSGNAVKGGLITKSGAWIILGIKLVISWSWVPLLWITKMNYNLVRL